MCKEEVCIVIQTLYDILGLTNPTVLEEYVILIFCCVLLFFGSIVIFNAALSFLTSIFNFER